MTQLRVQGPSFRHQPDWLGVTGLILVLVGLLEMMIPSVILVAELLQIREIVDPQAPQPQMTAEEYGPTVLVIRSGFLVLVVGTMVSLVGLRWKRRTLALSGAVVGLLVTSAIVLLLLTI